MFFVLLLVTVAYFVIIAKLRNEHTESFKKCNVECFRNSFAKTTAYIFEFSNKVSLALLAALLVYNIMKNKVSGFEISNDWNVEFLLWIAFIHLATTTFLCGLLEIVALSETVSKKEKSQGR